MKAEMQVAVASLKRVKAGFLLPSAAYTIQRKQIRSYEFLDKAPVVGDLIYGRVTRLGEHAYLENKEGRIHIINDGTRAVFVLGNRYAPAYFEGCVPESLPKDLDLLSRSGVVGQMLCKSNAVKDPTRVRVLGYICDEAGQPLNTRDFSLIKPKIHEKRAKRARMILSIGTAMNAGKSTTAVASCWALSTMGYTVRASKITGTASLKDILHMEDAGATPTTDFTYLGYPSTYLLSEAELLHIFDTLDLKYANNPKNFWVVEIADGILQRETAMLLRAEGLRQRIHRLLFSAQDALGAIGGIQVLKDQFGLVPDAISGICSASPLSVRELEAQTNIPVFNNLQPDLQALSEILL